MIRDRYIKTTFIKKIFTLGKTERLKSRKTIGQIFDSGNSFAVFPFRVFYLFKEAPGTSLQAGFGVSIKNFKKAVDRNRIKRLTREAYRLQKNQLQQALLDKKLHMALFFTYNGRELPLFTLVSGKIEVILLRLLNLVNEKPASTT